MYGLTAENITASGIKMTCRELAYMNMQMVSVTLDNTTKTKRKDSAFTSGRMVVIMKAGGQLASNTA